MVIGVSFTACIKRDTVLGSGLQCLFQNFDTLGIYILGGAE